MRLASLLRRMLRGSAAVWRLPPTLRRSFGWIAARRHPDRQLVEGHFDRDFYLARNPDVAAAPVDPLNHFLNHGWREGRDPSSAFSVRSYLYAHPEVAVAGVNPLLHHLRTATADSSYGDLGYRYEILAAREPIDERLRKLRRETPQRPLDSAEVLAQRLAQGRSALGDRLHVTFSQDDYLANVGGVQLCLQAESRGVQALGRRHLHIYPAAPLPTVRSDQEPGPLSLRLNGEALGAFQATDVARELAASAASGSSFAIHSLLGHHPDDVLAIVRALGQARGFFWLHDYASLCAGYTLLRNNVQDCGAPPPSSAACSICEFGPHRERHLRGHQALFQQLDLTLVSPSAGALAFWRERSAASALSSLVHPPAHLIPRQQRGALSAAEQGPLRIAFIGHAVPHKGWPVFRRIAEAHAKDPRYAFFHFGECSAGAPGVHFHPVRVTADGVNAMQSALEQQKIDVVVLWPLWRETFSFAVHEAIAAGCAVITSHESGNVARVVDEHRAGLVLQDLQAALQAFSTGGLRALARSVRQAPLYDLRLRGMTADLLAGEVAAA